MSSSIQVPDGPDVNIGGPLITTAWALYGITIVIVGLRLYTQWRITKQIGWGDFLMFLSLVCGVVFCVSLSMGYRYGLGRHYFFLTQEERILATKWNYIGQPLSMMAATFGRMAFTLLMLHLFGTTQKRRWILWLLFWQGFIVNGTTIIVIFAQCENVQTLWDPEGYPGKCLSSHVQEFVGFVQCSLNSITDLFLTILPALIFRSLQMSIQLKLGLGFLLGLSVFAFVASVIKTVELQSLGSRGDYTFNTVTFLIWVAVECALVSVAASVPLIKPLFTRTRKISGDTMNSNSFRMREHGPRKVTRLPSGDEAGPHNSSVENILVIEGERIPRTSSSIVMDMSFGVSYDKGKEHEIDLVADGR